MYQGRIHRINREDEIVNLDLRIFDSWKKIMNLCQMVFFLPQVFFPW